MERDSCNVSVSYSAALILKLQQKQILLSLPQSRSYATLQTSVQALHPTEHLLT